jgi:MoaA/NifB/PqqE/SkfB family radical SAM enzyme
MSIQGFEPLLPDTWPLTKKMLTIACKLGCETSLVTNGTYLAEHVAELSGFFGLADTVTVSLDSYCPEQHDKIRRQTGAFKAAIAGIEALAPNFFGSLQVNSILMPHRVRYLENMPELLTGLGIKKWAISPYIQINSGEAKVPHGEQMRLDIELLIEKAEQLGIDVFLSNELRQYEGNDLFKGFYIQTLPQGANIFRLSPDGSCSRDIEILANASQTQKWNKEEDPTSFLARIFGEIGVSFEPRSYLMRQFAALRIKNKPGLGRR